jgi:hypothetical protein
MVVGDYKKHVADQVFDPSAFAPPPMGADVFKNTAIARKNFLWGPGGWGVNIGLHKDFNFGERVTATLGADFDNIFNHRIKMPNQDFGDSSFSYLGGFDVQIDQNTLMPTIEDVNPASDFARLYSSFSQEGVSGTRTVRLRLRVTF